MKYFHVPVLLKEVIEYLRPKQNQNFIDCTVGGGGHTLEILKLTAPEGKVLAIDLDEKAIAEAQVKIQGAKLKPERVIFVCDNFKNLKKIATGQKFNKVKGILLDLGLSSAQLEDRERGFSFQGKGPLDMRFGGKIKTTATQILNVYPEKKLEQIFYEFGQEKLARPIAKEIVLLRKQEIDEVFLLQEICQRLYRKYYKTKSKIHPATKVFQALRIAVNEELTNLREVLPQALDLLMPQGSLAVISYHSLEDRIVKIFFRQEAKGCLCPQEFPLCQCTHKPRLRIITKKPVRPSEEELKQNPRARSAKLRVAQKL